MTAPKPTIPGYQADEEHDGKSPRTGQRRLHAEPEQPDTDPEAGSGTVDFESGRRPGGEGADAPSHGSA